MAKFDDGKDEGALRTIGEVAKATGIKAHVLRYWEDQFPMLKPLTRSGGRRYYRSEDVELVEKIDRLVNQQGYTLKGAKAALKGVPDQQAAAQAGTPSVSSNEELIGKLKAIRTALHRALAA
ncbi:MerR family transcriptional regulator [Qipengyuania sp. XHP0207]|uniref:MerR family transcriptional regulator n=1 Tax=Qipengyuania sp. XHP0207 TaxID=3038078 RepID=UPI00241F93A2|nr:MerR family transcriptional regulator [Qipengyuania sp. XHP0207]MDG5747069.1 MerR family transcriptional regulator [Qipengyuania sp. XHP0207]